MGLWKVNNGGRDKYVKMRHGKHKEKGGLASGFRPCDPAEKSVVTTAVRPG